LLDDATYIGRPTGMWEYLKFYW